MTRVLFALVVALRRRSNRGARAPNARARASSTDDDRQPDVILVVARRRDLPRVAVVVVDDVIEPQRSNRRHDDLSATSRALFPRARSHARASRCRARGRGLELDASFLTRSLARALSLSLSRETRWTTTSSTAPRGDAAFEPVCFELELGVELVRGPGLFGIDLLFPRVVAAEAHFLASSVEDVPAIAISRIPPASICDIFAPS